MLTDCVKSQKDGTNKTLFVTTLRPENKPIRDKLEKICVFYNSLCSAAMCLESTYSVHYKIIPQKHV